jgi:hypothetical protein
MKARQAAARTQAETAEALFPLPGLYRCSGS